MRLVSSGARPLHTGVVTGRAQSIRLQRFSHGFTVLTADAVDDGGFARVALQYFQYLRLRIHSGNDAVHQIGTVERADKQLRFFQPKLLDDIVAHALGGCRRVCMYAGLGKAGFEVGELAIFGPEVVSPVADAVCFVDREGAHIDAREELQKTRRQQSFRCYEHQSISAGHDLCFGFADGFGSHSTIKSGGWIATLTQTIDLILHQRNERGDDDVRTLR